MTLSFITSPFPKLLSETWVWCDCSLDLKLFGNTGFSLRSFQRIGLVGQDGVNALAVTSHAGRGSLFICSGFTHIPANVLDCFPFCHLYSLDESFILFYFCCDACFVGFSREHFRNPYSSILFLFTEYFRFRWNRLKFHNNFYVDDVGVWNRVLSTYWFKLMFVLVTNFANKQFL